MISSVVDEVSKSATMGEEGAIVKLDLVQVRIRKRTTKVLRTERRQNETWKHCEQVQQQGRLVSATGGREATTEGDCVQWV